MSVSSAGRFQRGLAGLLAAVAETSWVALSFFAVSLLVFGVAVDQLSFLQDLYRTKLGQLVSGGLVYALVLFVVILPVWIMRKGDYVKRLLGIDRWPGRTIWWLPLLLWAGYMVATIAAAVVANYLLPWVDSEQPQDIGFDNLTLPVEYVVAFIALVVLPPIAEELLLRGYLFGRIREKLGFWSTTIIVSLIFGLAHGQWNVGIDTAILSIFLCYLRERTGTIWASIVLHAIKNGLAYFLLFIAPLVGLSIGS